MREALLPNFQVCSKTNQESELPVWKPEVASFPVLISGFWKGKGSKAGGSWGEIRGPFQQH